ncbi:MAG: hypothetical protein ACI9F9_002043 [Candidatus Paceibacteria bacterium]|jgi:hypothetical protein
MWGSLILFAAFSFGGSGAASPMAALRDDHQALLKQLQSAEGQDLSQAWQKGFEQMMVEIRAYRAAPARALAEAMHQRAQATWSAMSLALICTRMGDSASATRVLREAVERSTNKQEQYELLERLGLALRGAGFDKDAQGPLGSAFARGSANAGVVLGRIALQEGRRGQARSIFRTLLPADPPQAWALRGWGLSMLPTRQDPAARVTPSSKTKN